MAMFQLNMGAITLELARHDSRYLPFVHRFGQYFAVVTHVLQRGAAGGAGLWQDEGQFYFDVIRHGGERMPLPVYSMAGLVPLFAAAVVRDSALDGVGRIRESIDTIFERRPDLHKLMPGWARKGTDGTRMLSVVDRERLGHLMRRTLDEDEFLSDYGIRSLSRRHLTDPFRFEAGGERYDVRYLPGVSDNRMFGGNSNWRVPIWFPMNYLLIQALSTLSQYYGDSLTFECPVGSGRHLTLAEIADDLAARLVRIFTRDPQAGGRRAVLGDNDRFQSDPHWRDYLPFHEFFHGDSGAGLGASHQTGWTALVALLLQRGGAQGFDRFAPPPAAQLHEVTS
jgi:hypothetical protein